MNDLEWKLIDRFKEPSSFNALAVAIGALGLNMPPGVIQAVSYLVSGACILAGFLLKEGAK